MFPIIEDSRLKDKCQIFTPREYVEKMLDLAQYNENLYGKKFLENSCGDGEILVQAVVRYIKDCKRKQYSLKKIKQGLENDFVAYEVDENRIAECKSRLNKILSEYKIKDVIWNIKSQDYLKTENTDLYDFVVGNPPYIAYPDLPNEIQNFVKEKFDSCKKGKFDYSYAFIEKSYLQLNDAGKLVYIIPSNIFKNVFAKKLREIILNDISSIIDFPTDIIFKNVLVSPAIIKIVKNSNCDQILYCNAESQKYIHKTKLGQNKWTFDEEINTNGIKIRDNFKVSSAVATLLNEAFILREGSVNGDFYEIGNQRIELTLLRKAASPKNKKYKKYEEYIIFPYHYDEKGKLQHYSEEEMYIKFPCGMKYLENYKEKLAERDSDNSAKWFEYGRSQALQNINKRLILISSIISECTEPYILEVDEIPYSGLYIMSKGAVSVESLMPILRTENFKNYINNIGVSVSGTSKRISPKDIENYVY